MLNLFVVMRNKITVGLVAIIALFISIFGAAQIFAADFSASLKTTVTVDDFESFARVVTILEVENNSGAETPTAIDLPVYGKNIKALKATYQDNGSNISTSLNEEASVVTLETTKSFKGENRKWSLKLTYSTNVIEELGDSKLILLGPTYPTISGMDVVSEERSLALDFGMGAATRLGAKPPESDVAIGRQILIWKEDSNVYYATGVVYGDSSLTTVDIATELKNDGLWWKNFTVVLPPDTNQQRVVVEKINPMPKSVSVDIDGNVLLHYKLGPKASIKVTAEAQALVNNYTYALSKATDTISDDELTHLSSYLVTTKRWSPTDAEIDTSKPTLDIIEQIKQAVRAIDASTLGDDEFEQIVNRNDIFVGTLRSNSIPARVVRGIVQTKGVSRPHAWAEAYIGGLGWITADSQSDTNSLNTADSRYVALLIRSADDSYPPSRIKDTTVTYIAGSELPTPEGEPQLKSTTYVVLPGIGVRITSVTMPPGPIVDNNAIHFINDRITHLGSLAPFQTIVSRDLVLGSASMSSNEAIYGILDEDGEVTEAVRATIDVSWLPLIVETIGLAVLIVAAIYVRKRGWPKLKLKRGKKKSKPSKTEDMPKKTKKKSFFSRGKKKTIMTEEVMTPKPKSPSPQERSSSKKPLDSKPPITTPTDPARPKRSKSSSNLIQ